MFAWNKDLELSCRSMESKFILLSSQAFIVQKSRYSVKDTAKELYEFGQKLYYDKQKVNICILIVCLLMENYMGLFKGVQWLMIESGKHICRLKYINVLFVLKSSHML